MSSYWQLGHIHPGTPGIRFAAPGDRAARSAALGRRGQGDVPSTRDRSSAAPYKRQVVTAEWGTALDCRDGFAALPPNMAVLRCAQPDWAGEASRAVPSRSRAAVRAPPQRGGRSRRSIVGPVASSLGTSTSLTKESGRRLTVSSVWISDTAQVCPTSTPMSRLPSGWLTSERVVHQSPQLDGYQRCRVRTTDS